MAKIVESLKRLSVENGVKKHNGHTATKKTSELTLMIEEAVSLDKNYVLSLCGTQSEPEFRIATALSDHSCIVYSVGETLSKTVTLNHNDSPIIGIKFSPTSKNIIYTATNDGQITMCDLRAKGKVIAEFKDNTEDGKLKPLASFDISTNERLMAGGTEHTGGDAFILFWDIRHTSSKTDNKTNLLGGYWESHMDDVTCLAFHPNKSDVLASGSTDGLINVFNLTQPSEDLALTYSLNTEVAADRLGWLTEDNLWCTSHTCLQLWNCDDATPYSTFDRNHLATIQNDEADNCYFVKVHVTDALGEPFLLAGSSSVQSNRENLRCLSFTNDRLETHYNPLGNKQIVRDSWLHEKSGSLITGGENGIINIWKVTDTAPVAKTSEHKMVAKIGGGKNRDRHHRTKPY